MQGPFSLADEELPPDTIHTTIYTSGLVPLTLCGKAKLAVELCGLGQLFDCLSTHC